MTAADSNYLSPKADWMQNLELFFQFQGHHMTKEESEAVKAYDKLNTSGKIAVSLAVTVTSIVLGILLGIVLHPAALSICVFSIVGIGARAYFKNQAKPYIKEIKSKEDATLLIISDIIKELGELRKNIHNESIEKHVFKNSFKTEAIAKKASIKAIKSLLEKNRDIKAKHERLKEISTKLNYSFVPDYSGKQDGDSYRQVFIHIRNAVKEVFDGYKIKYPADGCYHKVYEKEKGSTLKCVALSKAFGDFYLKKMK